MYRHIRHVGCGELAIFEGDERVGMFGVFGGSQRDRDELIVRYNGYAALQAERDAQQKAHVVAMDAKHAAWESAVRERDVAADLAAYYEAECARLREDAERYRWLRENADCIQWFGDNGAWTFEELDRIEVRRIDMDAALDDAMKEQVKA